MKREFPPLVGPARFVLLVVPLVCGTGYAQNALEDQLGRTLVQWRMLGSQTFATVQKVPRHCELIVRVRRTGNLRNPRLELWRADQIGTTAGPVFVQPMRTGPRSLQVGPYSVPEAAYGPQGPAVGPLIQRQPPADDGREARLARWANFSKGQTWACELPKDCYIGLLLQTNRGDKHLRVESRNGYHTLRYRSGWAFDVWVVPEDQWIDR